MPACTSNPVPEARPVGDGAKRAAQQACLHYEQVDLWTYSDVPIGPPSQNDSFTLVRVAPGANERVSLIGGDVAVARRDPRYVALGRAFDTLTQLMYGDRSEVSEAQHGMGTACQNLRPPQG